MSKIPFAFRVECEKQEWSGSDVPYCECTAIPRGPLKKVGEHYSQSITGCYKEVCPKNKEAQKQKLTNKGCH